MRSCIVFPTILTSPDDGYDYRPAISPAGDIVIFERWSFVDGSCKLYWCSTTPPFNAKQVFASDGPFDPEYAQQTRPDWSSATGMIIFNASNDGGATNFVCTIGSDIFDNPYEEPNVLSLDSQVVYPRWNLDGKSFVGMRTSVINSGEQPPISTWYDLSGNVHADGGYTYYNISGTTPDSDENACGVYAGMPSVNQAQMPSGTGLPYIAFAGQAYPPDNSPVYGQAHNYIYITNYINPNICIPLEAGAPVLDYNQQFQGRAPDTSPFGDAVAFESFRFGVGQIYSIFLCNVNAMTGQSQPIQILCAQTDDPTKNVIGDAQHAKFAANGTSIVFCSHIASFRSDMKGIVMADVTKALAAIGCKTSA